MKNEQQQFDLQLVYQDSSPSNVHRDEISYSDVHRDYAELNYNYQICWYSLRYM